MCQEIVQKIAVEKSSFLKKIAQKKTVNCSLYI